MRSVGRYRPESAWLAGLVGLAGVFVLLTSAGDASPRSEPPIANEPARIGMNSCASRGCHGAVGATDPGQGRVYIKDGAYTTWLQYDPHARAFSVLLDQRSIHIAEKLRGPLEGKPAHESGLCLSCHATVGPPEAKVPLIAPLADGISCEACHGPAEVWQDKHLSPSWRAQSASKKALDGLTDLSTPTARARACVGCHVGDRSRGMDVNHDLIAAGHPRLNFEFATYQASYPKHWQEKGDPAQFEAKSWAIGQVVTAEAVVDLLVARALASKSQAVTRAPAPDAVWPEFSEYECFGCHRNLINPSPRQLPGRPLGRLAWQTWPSTMLPELVAERPGLTLGAWSSLGGLMSSVDPDPDAVVKLAVEARQELEKLLKAVESKPIDPAWIDAHSKELADRQPAIGDGWDRLTQRFLALQAMVRSSRAAGLAIAPEVEALINKMAEALEFPANFDSPKNVPPGAKPGDPAQPVR